jgi:hypothetical protein
MFVLCPFVCEETNGSYLSANGLDVLNGLNRLNELNGLAHLWANLTEERNNGSEKFLQSSLDSLQTLGRGDFSACFWT